MAHRGSGPPKTYQTRREVEALEIVPIAAPLPIQKRHQSREEDRFKPEEHCLTDPEAAPLDQTEMETGMTRRMRTIKDLAYSMNASLV